MVAKLKTSFNYHFHWMAANDCFHISSFRDFFVFVFVFCFLFFLFFVFVFLVRCFSCIRHVYMSAPFGF
jgi:hypothetical protein